MRTSSPKYWIMVVPAEKSELRAVPASTMDSGEKLRSFDRAKISRTAPREHTKALPVTR